MIPFCIKPTLIKRLSYLIPFWIHNLPQVKDLTDPSFLFWFQSSEFGDIRELFGILVALQSLANRQLAAPDSIFS